MYIASPNPFELFRPNEIYLKMLCDVSWGDAHGRQTHTNNTCYSNIEGEQMVRYGSEFEFELCKYKMYAFESYNYVNELFISFSLWAEQSKW